MHGHHEVGLRLSRQAARGCTGEELRTLGRLLAAEHVTTPQVRTFAAGIVHAQSRQLDVMERHRRVGAGVE